MKNCNQNVFQSFYSKYYDLIYETKDYKKECDRVENLIEHNPKIKKILDIGCGTCNHSIEFSKRGYHVVALDQSNEMLKIAKKKIAEKKIKNIQLVQGNAEMFALKKQVKFDAVFLLFYVLGYIKNLEEFIKNIKKHLKKNALLIFDFWHESAINHKSPGTSIKKFNQNQMEFIKISKGKINKKKKLIEINIRTSLEKEGNLVSKSEELHLVKYYNLEFLKIFFERNGFKLIRFEDFNHQGTPPNKKSWNAYGVSRYL